MPVLAELAYLNAGTDGPLPVRSVQAAMLELERAAHEGRARGYFERRTELMESLRGAYAAVLGCAPEDLALTSCTSEGMAIVLEGLELGPSQEVLTSDEEHPGLLGALAAARELRRLSVRMVPLEEIAAAVGPRTALVACSHVGWTSGRIAPDALAELGVPVLLD
jgi:L-cysteine/cystine lyase